MEIRAPFNLQKWIDENKHLLKPPVANKNLYPDAAEIKIYHDSLTKNLHHLFL